MILKIYWIEQMNVGIFPDIKCGIIMAKLKCPQTLLNQIESKNRTILINELNNNLTYT
jgi:hypothetical protein